MFDIGFSEILLIGVAALIAVGPKDLPNVLFRLGRFVRQIKIFTGGIRDQYADIMHEAEVAHYRKELQAMVVKEPALESPKHVMLPLETKTDAPSETKDSS